MPTATWTAYASADTAIAGSALNALASGGVAWGSAIDNSTARALLGDLFLEFRDGSNNLTTVTMGGGTPYLGVYIVPLLNNGTDDALASAGAAPGYLQRVFPWRASTAERGAVVRQLVLPPHPFRVLIEYVGGTAMPANNNNLCVLRRYGEEA